MKPCIFVHTLHLLCAKFELSIKKIASYTVLYAKWKKKVNKKGDSNMTTTAKQKLVNSGIYTAAPLQMGEEYSENDPDILIDAFGNAYRVDTHGLDDPNEVSLLIQMRQAEDIASIKKMVIFGIIWFVVLPICFYFILVVSGVSFLELLFR